MERTNALWRGFGPPTRLKGPIHDPCNRQGSHPNRVPQCPVSPSLLHYSLDLLVWFFSLCTSIQWLTLPYSRSTVYDVPPPFLYRCACLGYTGFALRKQCGMFPSLVSCVFPEQRVQPLDVGRQVLPLVRQSDPAPRAYLQGPQQVPGVIDWTPQKPNQTKPSGFKCFIFYFFIC